MPPSIERKKPLIRESAFFLVHLILIGFCSDRIRIVRLFGSLAAGRLQRAVMTVINENRIRCSAK
ncbi:MAG: hypothetical protein ACC608_06955 [Anaerofustis sp.]